MTRANGYTLFTKRGLEMNTRPLFRRTHSMISAKSLTALACALLLVVAAATPAPATPPTKISYQGRLTDASGNPANGTGNITFKIYHVAAAGSGTSVWDETQTSVSVSSGIFQVELGSVTALGGGSENLTTLFATDTYLEVVIPTGSSFGLTGTNITLPSSGNRPQLLTTPYTFRATLAEGLTTAATPSITSLTTSGALNAGGDFKVATTKFQVASASGNTSIAGTLTVTQTSTLTGAVTVSNGIDFGAGANDDLTAADVTALTGAGATTLHSHEISSTAITDGTIAGADLAANIAISTTGTIATTGGSAITSSGLLTASSPVASK